MNFTLTRDMIETMILLNHSASTDETRMYLNGIHLKTNEDNSKLLLESANGYILARQEYSWKHGKLDVIFPSEKIKALKEMLKADKDKYYYECSFNDYDTSMSIEDKTFRVINRDYPKIDAVIPKKEGDTKIILNAELLIALAKSFIPGGKSKDKCIELTFTDNKSPIIVRTKESNQYGVIMPCRELK